MSLGNRLKECRKVKKKTQVDLAKELSLNRSTYAKYETGDNEPDNDTLQKLADYFEVSVDYLLGRTDDPAPAKMEEEKPLNVAFFGGRKEVLTEEEADKLQEALEIHRMLKEKRMKEQKKQ